MEHFGRNHRYPTMTHKPHPSLKPTLIWLQIAALLLLLAFPGKAHACSCDFDPTLGDKESLTRSFESQYNRIVFVGEVTNVQEINRLADHSQTLFPLFVTFAVETVYKGDIADTFTVTTDIDGGTCGYDFSVGKTYLAFVGDGGGEDSFYTGLCANNQPNPSAEMLAVFGDGYAPSPDGSSGALELETTSESNDAVFPTAINQPVAVLVIAATILSLIVYGLSQYRGMYEDDFESD